MTDCSKLSLHSSNPLCVHFDGWQSLPVHRKLNLLGTDTHKYLSGVEGQEGIKSASYFLPASFRGRRYLFSYSRLTLHSTWEFNLSHCNSPVSCSITYFLLYSVPSISSSLLAFNLEIHWDLSHSLPLPPKKPFFSTYCHTKLLPLSFTFSNESLCWLSLLSYLSSLYTILLLFLPLYRTCSCQGNQWSNCLV